MSHPLRRPVGPWPLPSRHAEPALWGLGLAALFIIYETLLPFAFSFTRDQLAEGLERATFNLFYGPYGIRSGRADLLGNVLLFGPLGFFLALTPIALRSGRARWFALTGLGCGLSFAVETLQLFSPYRFTQTTDLVTNTVGTLLGVVLAGIWGQRLWDQVLDRGRRHLLDDPAPLVLLALTAAILLGALLPFDLCIRRDVVAYHLRTLDWSLTPPLPPRAGLSASLALVKAAWLFAFWGAAAAYVGEKRPRPLLTVLAWAALLAVAAELSKLFVYSRSLALRDVLVGWLGAAGGGVLWRQGRRAGLSRRTLGLLFGAGYGIYLVADTVSPLGPTVLRLLFAGQRPQAGGLQFAWIPFQGAGQVPTAVALGEWSARLVRFLPLGAALRLGLPAGRRRWAVALAAAVLVLALQLVVGWLGPWPGNASEVILAWGGMILGAWAAGRLARLRAAES
jgi:glycopeptide antibiotics resistance protein